jgi:ABC-type multidrug transport system fused ATPase/permease subunit
MERTLFSFIWKYSRKSQLILLVVTLLTFPLLFATLELPKRIINDAIGGSGESITKFGIQFNQTQLLLVLCFGFLVVVLAHGMLKMQLNTMKGVLAERLLRRFRFQLLSRMLRFPRPYFRSTSQGELVSMVTSEAEPMGGLMGDALSQPIFQAGQMLTILAFLFAQSIWFGLASIALIPLQAWLIPRLQRQINLLNKSRIQEVRKLAADIGESAAGISDIRINGGLRYRMAVYSDRLGRLFIIRLQIYQKKFFMKFLNNFINQLTPFFFYSVGGYLAIRGQITVGALVAALAAYKDLASPWKELLTYYNLVQDMSLRWEIVTERFAPKTIVEDALFEGEPVSSPSLNGDIVLKNVSVRDEEGHLILEDLNLTIPKGSRVAIKTSSEIAGSAFADLLTREIIPFRGSVTIAGHNLNDLHQTVVAARIGYAHSRPYLFEGTLGENLLMPLKQSPNIGADAGKLMSDWQAESARSGNSIDPLMADWLDPKIAGFETYDEVREWWFNLVEAMGVDDFMVRRALRSRLEHGAESELAAQIVALRPEIEARIKDAGLDDIVHAFHPDRFNPVSPMGSNLLYALPTRLLQQSTLALESNFVRILREQGIDDVLAHIATSVVDGLTTTFGQDGTDHPLFQRLNLDEELYHTLGKISEKLKEVGKDGVGPADFALFLTVPFAFSAEQIGPAFNAEFKEKVMMIRKSSAERMVAELDGLFATIDPTKYIPVMTVFGNAIFGRVSGMAGAREELIENIVVDVLNEHGLRRQTAQSIHDLQTGLGGANLPAVFRERAAFSRAGIKRPDILILEKALVSHDAESRSKTRERLSELLPNATKIFIESNFNNPDAYDLYVEIVDGRIDGVTRAEPEVGDVTAKADLNRKLDAIAKVELFANLDRRNQRLLAFSAQWYKVKSGQLIFAKGQTADAAYICVQGKAGLYWHEEGLSDRQIAEINPGRLIGDLALIVGEPRPLDLRALEESLFLRIGAAEFRAIVENDAAVATSLLKTVAGHLNNSADALRRALTEKNGAQ